MSKLVGLTVILLCMLGASANAQGPTLDAYGGAAGVLGDVATGGSGPGAKPIVPPSPGIVPEPRGGLGPDTGNDDVLAAKSGVRTGTDDSGTGPAPTFVAQPMTTRASLPFTGLDLGFLAAGSVLLVAVGFGLRRMGRVDREAV